MLKKIAQSEYFYDFYRHSGAMRVNYFTDQNSGKILSPQNQF